MIKIKRNIAVSETGFLFDPQTGETFNLNKTGQMIFKFLTEQRDEVEIMKIISGQYEIDPNTFQRYLDEFKMILKQFNLTEKEEE
jgi:hypothetical protein